MKSVLRKVAILLMVVILVPAIAWISLEILRGLHLGLRFDSDREKVDYLIGAAENNARGEVGRVLNLGIVPATAEDGKGYTVLMAAALGGDAEIVRMLLERGAPPNARLRETKTRDKPAGLTALMMAVSQGKLEAARLLLARGADPNPEILEGIYKGQTALFMAVLKGQLALVEDLLSKGASPRAHHENPDGVVFFPLTVALRDNRLDIAERLVAYGSDVDWMVPSGGMVGCTQLMLIATFRGAPATARTVAWVARRTRKGMYVPFKGGCSGHSALTLAARIGNMAAVKGMLAPTVKGTADEVFLMAAHQAAMEAKHQAIADFLSERLNQCRRQPECRVNRRT